ncbi:ABC transporter ATP-binding protein [Micrococcoides hystricis]|uniref:ABC transporter ATP-binding protein n=1 Tax=Micrococcoides hystricis TaxID=1572761 RepID=A0ABV6PBC5_9MICC
MSEQELSEQNTNPPQQSEKDEKKGRQQKVKTAKAKDFWGSLKRLAALLGTEKRILIVAIALGIVTVVLNVWAPLLLGASIDVIFDGQRTGAMDYAELTRLILTVLLMYLVAQISQWWSGFLLNDGVMRIIYKLRGRIEDKVHRIPLAYFDKNQRGDLLSRTTNDVDNVQQALQQGFASLVNSVLQVLGIAIIMFALSWQLALIALVAVPLSGFVVGIIGPRSQRRFTQQWAATGSLNGHIEEAFTGHSLVRLFGQAASMEQRFANRNTELYDASFRAQFLSGMIMPLMQAVNLISYVAIAVVGALQVTAGTLSLGQVTAFIQYSREFNQPLGQLAGMANMVQSGVASAERVFSFLDAEEEEDAAAEPTQPERAEQAAAEQEASEHDAGGEVVFEDVSFSYSADTPLIQDLNLVAHPGQTVAIVGPTGAGKTTLVNLLMRFYELDAGRILLDGVDITSVSREQLRRNFGMVLQDAVLFKGTIMENIRYGRLDATDEEVYEAARACYVDRFVQTLPEGYDTEVDVDSGAISAGERQLITIARAFLSRPTVLILDEATSAVDTRTEMLVQQAMAALRSGRTSFVIAHRLSTIQDADVILVLEKGQIVEQGSHSELMAARGAYYQLQRSQFTMPSVSEDQEIRESAVALATGQLPVTEQ